MRASEIRELSTAERTRRIDLGLALSRKYAAEIQEPLTKSQIAAFCGCSHTLIYQIERRALAKLRRKLRSAGVVL